MAIEIKFKLEGCDELFENPMDAVSKGAFLSQSQGGKPVKLMRGVKYTHSKEFKWTSMTNIELPMPLTDDGPTAYDHDGTSAPSVFQRKETF